MIFPIDQIVLLLLDYDHHILIFLYPGIIE